MRAAESVTRRRGPRRSVRSAGPMGERASGTAAGRAAAAMCAALSSAPEQAALRNEGVTGDRLRDRKRSLADSATI